MTEHRLNVEYLGVWVMIITHSVCPYKLQVRMALEVQAAREVQVARYSLFLVDQVAPEGLVGQ